MFLCFKTDTCSPCHSRQSRSGTKKKRIHVYWYWQAEEKPAELPTCLTAVTRRRHRTWTWKRQRTWIGLHFLNLSNLSAPRHVISGLVLICKSLFTAHLWPFTRCYSFWESPRLLYFILQCHWQLVSLTGEQKRKSCYYLFRNKSEYFWTDLSSLSQSGPGWPLCQWFLPYFSKFLCCCLR